MGKDTELRKIGRLRSCEMFFRHGGVPMCQWVDLLIGLGASAAAV
jgi:hypothetical protein